METNDTIIAAWQWRWYDVAPVDALSGIRNWSDQLALSYRGRLNSSPCTHGYRAVVFNLGYAKTS
jgi:hypothetical protein